MDHLREHRDDAGEEKSLASWLEKTGLKLVPLLAVALLLYLFLKWGVIIALAAFLCIAVLSSLGGLLFRLLKRS